MLKKCIICNKGFKTKSRAVCCSPECNRERKKEYDIKWNREKYKREKAKTLKRQKNYNKENKENRKKYNIANKEKILKYNNECYQTDINFRLVSCLRARINTALKNDYKSTSSIKLLGIDIGTYKQYLESQFDKNMNWGNYGQYWEIDHIKPLNVFDLSKSEQQLVAFNYKNTRPLEKIENKSRPKDGSDIPLVLEKANNIVEVC